MYLQFSLDHVHILSPSVAMETHLNQRGWDSADDGSEKMEGMNEETSGGQKKRKLEEAAAGPPSAPSAVMSTGPSDGRQCVSMVIRVEHKEGVSWRNAGVGLKEAQVGLVLGFRVRAAVMGPVVSWRRDPKNRPMLEKESEKEKKVRTQNRPDLTSPIMHLCSCSLSPGGPGILRKASWLVPCHSARILLQTGRPRLAGKSLLVSFRSDLRSVCRYSTADWFLRLSVRILVF